MEGLRSETPVSSTGVVLTGGERDAVSESVDWLTWSFPVEVKGDVLAFVAGMFGEPAPMDAGRNTYKSGLAWDTGASLLWSDGRSDACLSLNGDSLELCTVQAVYSLLVQLRRLGAKCTRVDLALDFYDRKLLPLDEVYSSAESGNFAGFQKVRPLKEIKRTESGTEIVGQSVTFGNRGKQGSGRQVVIYDKEKESKGLTKSTRWEARFYKERAEQAVEFLLIADGPGEFEKQVRRLAVGAVAFVDRSMGSGRLDRQEPLAWYSRLMAVVSKGVRLKLPRLRNPLQSSANYVGRAWVRTFAKFEEICDGLGLDFWGSLRGAVTRERNRDDLWVGDLSRILHLDLGEAFGVHRVLQCS